MKDYKISEKMLQEQAFQSIKELLEKPISDAEFEIEYEALYNSYNGSDVIQQGFERIHDLWEKNRPNIKKPSTK